MTHPHLRFAGALLGAALAAATLAPPAAAQQSRFVDTTELDAHVAAFTGAGIGEPGGARSAVDGRLRLAACPNQIALDWHGRGASMVKVECTGSTPWRIFVPVAALEGVGAAQPTASQNRPSAPPAEPQVVVERGQVISITVQGSSFSVSQQGEALESGAIGEWIRVRPDGNREALRARIDTPGRVVIPLR